MCLRFSQLTAARKVVLILLAVRLGIDVGPSERQWQWQHLASSGGCEGGWQCLGLAAGVGQAAGREGDEGSLSGVAVKSAAAER